MGFYLDPDDTSSIEHVVSSMEQRPHGDKLMVVRAFDAEIVDSEGNTQEKVLAVDLAYLILEDMSSHFLLYQIP